jgi:hypothetical protein
MGVWFSLEIIEYFTHQLFEADWLKRAHDYTRRSVQSSLSHHRLDTLGLPLTGTTIVTKQEEQSRKR